MPVSGTLEVIKKGLTAAQIKWIALFFMTVDHLAAFGFEIPLIDQHYTNLRRLGRIAMPLFLFILVQSAHHTRSKPRFLLRLYLAGMGSYLFVATTNFFLGDWFGVHSPGNIISTFFYTVLYILLIEKFIGGVREKRPAAAAAAVLTGTAAVLLPPIMCDALMSLLPQGAGVKYIHLAGDLLESFLPTVWNGDYGWGVIVLGVVLYFAGTKRRQCAVFAGFCLLCLTGAFLLPADLGPVGYTYLGSFINTFCDLGQCYMVLALPFMMLYNGQRGRGGKWFFYIYYPTHRYAISVISHLLYPV